MAALAANFLYATPREIGRATRDRQRLLVAKRGAYDWIRQHASPDARIISYEDGLAYLYTGRQSIRPIASLTQAFYRDDSRLLPAREKQLLASAPVAYRSPDGGVTVYDVRCLWGDGKADCPAPPTPPGPVRLPPPQAQPASPQRM